MSQSYLVDFQFIVNYQFISLLIIKYSIDFQIEGKIRSVIN